MDSLPTEPPGKSAGLERGVGGLLPGAVGAVIAENPMESIVKR